MPEPIERLTFNAADLMYEHPPVLRHTNKLVVFTIACGEGCEYSGNVGYTRWRALELPEMVDVADALGRATDKEGIFDYEPVADLPGAVEWHVNFADPLLFYAYGSGLFAQDEMQSAEHPVLGALVEALHVGSHRAMTEDESGPTPVLVTGVERRCHVATDRDADAGRPRGLYGNEFSAASIEVIKQATTRLDPPTVSNLIALAAPSYGVGPYTREVIERILVTAYTGFEAAVTEGHTLAGEQAPIVVHTGYWGCGVFGGNRVLMSVLQVLAAGMAGVDRLVFHTAAPEGAAPFEEGVRRLREEFGDVAVSSAELLDRLTAMGFMWGMTNGS